MSVTDGKPPRMRPAAASVVLAVVAAVGFVGVWSTTSSTTALVIAALAGNLAIFGVMKVLFPDPPDVRSGRPSDGGTASGESEPPQATWRLRVQSWLGDLLFVAAVLLALQVIDRITPEGFGGEVLGMMLLIFAFMAFAVGRVLVSSPLPPEARRGLLGVMMIPLALVAACFALPALAWAVGWLSAPFAVLLAPALAAALTVAAAMGPVGVSVMFVLRPRLDGRHAVAIRRSRWRMHYGILQASQVHALLGSGDIAGAESRFIQLFGRGGWLGLVPYLQFTIARVLVAKGELREGVALMERAVRGLDPSVAPGDEFAVALLLAEDDPALALEAVDAALAHTVVPRPFGFIGYDPRAEQHAARAWALAALGRADEAHAAMREAEKRSNPRLVAKAAEIHWRLARARLALGDPAGAAAEARKGVGDTGLFGNLCRALAG